MWKALINCINSKNSVKTREIYINWWRTWVGTTHVEHLCWYQYGICRLSRRRKTCVFMYLWRLDCSIVV